MTMYEQYATQYNQKWQRRIVKTNITAAIVILAFEIIYYFILTATNLRTQSTLEYTLAFIVIPTALILLWCIVSLLAVCKSSLSADNKSLVALLAMVGICCVVASTHNIFPATVCSFFVPLSVSVVFGKKYITNIVAICCIIGEAISLAFASLDLRGNDPYFLLDCLMLFIVFAILWYSALLLMKNEQEKRSLIDNMWQEQSMLQRKICRDDLTGLYNLLGLQLFADNKISEKNLTYRNSSIAFLDIDDFKTVNDTYGHEAGNHALNYVASLISSHFSYNCCVARYGGDEFVVLLPGVSTAECKAILDRLLLKAANTSLPELQGDVITLSCGVAQYGFTTPVLDAINSSDQAMYKAKSEGKNRTIVA